MHYRYFGRSHLIRTAKLAPLFVAPVNVVALLVDFRELMDDVVGPHCTISLSHAPGGYAVAIEAWALQMILLEILINASEATPSGGVLVITTEPAPVSSDLHLLPGEYMRLSIADPGCGMTKDVESRAFDPLFSTKKSHLGVGLSQVADLLACSGSRAYIETNPAHGTTIHLYLRRGSELIAVPEPMKGIYWRQPD